VDSPCCAKKLEKISSPGDHYGFVCFVLIFVVRDYIIYLYSGKIGWEQAGPVVVFFASENMSGK
jgi:hypothetical protein